MKALGTKTLETERLILRKTESDDFEPMFRNWASDPRVTAFLTWAPYESAEQLKNSYHQHLLDRRDDPRFFDWKIVWKESGEPIGSIGVVELSDDDRCADIGYCLGVAWWRQGVMSEAFSRVIRFLFNEVGIERIRAAHDTRNPRSGAVMKRCGLRFESVAHSAGRNCSGEVCDLACYSLSKLEYLNQNETEQSHETQRH